MKRIVNGITLNVREQGDKEPALVFLHHWGGSGRTWTEVIAQLKGDFRCIAPDLRGFGTSDAPPSSTSYSVDDNADDVAALAAERGLRQWSLVGHSMGGKIALALAARRPPGLQSLILLAPSPPTPEPMEEDERARTRACYGDHDEAEAIVKKITVRLLALPIHVRTVADLVCVSRLAWQAWLDTGSRETISARLSQIEVPVFVLLGENDPVISRPLMEQELMPYLPTGTFGVKFRLTVVPDIGHLLPVEIPNRVSAFIRNVATPETLPPCRTFPSPRL